MNATDSKRVASGPHPQRVSSSSGSDLPVKIQSDVHTRKPGSPHVRLEEVGTIGRFFEERIKEFVETFNRTNRQTIDLFEKTLSVYQAASLADAQRGVYDIIESSLNALQVNVDSALKTNAKIIADWNELVDCFGLAVKNTRSKLSEYAYEDYAERGT
jgi:hypothetical protein